MNGSDLRNARGATASSEAGLDMLLRQLQEDIGLNLKQYKPNYLKRRIGVRMRATGCDDYLQYHQYVKHDRDEGKRLINDLTINVTEFFRDRDVFAAIRKEVIPRIIQYKRESGSYSLRAWSAGCATGEEPYSLSMLFLEALAREKEKNSWSLRITATDLDDKALEKARAGSYESVHLPPGLILRLHRPVCRPQRARHVRRRPAFNPSGAESLHALSYWTGCRFSRTQYKTLK